MTSKLCRRRSSKAVSKKPSTTKWSKARVKACAGIASWAIQERNHTRSASAELLRRFELRLLSQSLPRFFPQRCADVNVFQQRLGAVRSARALEPARPKWTRDQVECVGSNGGFFL